jgi:hypothetical protein
VVGPCDFAPLMRADSDFPICGFPAGRVVDGAAGQPLRNGKFVQEKESIGIRFVIERGRSCWSAIGVTAIDWRAGRAVGAAVWSLPRRCSHECEHGTHECMRHGARLLVEGKMDGGAWSAAQSFRG